MHPPVLAGPYGFTRVAMQTADGRRFHLIYGCAESSVCRFHGRRFFLFGCRNRNRLPQNKQFCSLQTHGRRHRRAIIHTAVAAWVRLSTGRPGAQFWAHYRACPDLWEPPRPGPARSRPAPPQIYPSEVT